MTLLTSLFQFKSWADAQLFDAVESLAPHASAEERHNAIRILNHIHTVDKIFVGNLQGKPHGQTATNTVETPALADLNWASQATDGWFVTYVAGLSGQDLAQEISFTFTDGDKGRMTREEMLMHVITHGSAHRGAVSRILFNQGVTPPRDLYTKFLHMNQPERRA